MFPKEIDVWCRRASREICPHQGRWASPSPFGVRRGAKRPANCEFSPARPERGCPSLSVLHCWSSWSPASELELNLLAPGLQTLMAILLGLHNFNAALIIHLSTPLFLSLWLHCQLSVQSGQPSTGMLHLPTLEAAGFTRKKRSGCNNLEPSPHVSTYKHLHCGSRSMWQVVGPPQSFPHRQNGMRPCREGVRTRDRVHAECGSASGGFLLPLLVYTEVSALAPPAPSLQDILAPSQPGQP